jgi:hypothetical protein
MQERPFWVFFVAKLAYFYVSPSGTRTFKTNIKPYNYYGTFSPSGSGTRIINTDMCFLLPVVVVI